MTNSENNHSPTNPLAFGRGFGLSADAVDTGVLDALYAESAQHLPSKVLTTLEAYAPEGLEGALADSVARFVRILVASTAPQNAHTLSQVRAAAAKLTIWAHVQRGLPLTYRLLLSDDVIQQWQTAVTKSGELSAGTASNYRGHLRRIAHEMGVQLRDEFQPLIRPSRTAPHSADELAEAMLWARTLTRLGSRRARVVILLGAGAGLGADEMRFVRGQDVLSGAGLWVKVGGTRPRLAPVLLEWAPKLRRLAEAVRPDEHLFPGAEGQAQAGFIDNWLTMQPHRGRLNLRRLRASYLAEQLRSGADDADVLAWSGLNRGEDLAKYLPFAGPVDPVRRNRLIRLRSTVPEEPKVENAQTEADAAHRSSGGRA